MQYKFKFNYEGRANINLSATVAADRAQGHSQYWLDDFSSIYKTLPEGVATHIYASFDDSLTPTRKTYASWVHLKDPLI